MTHYYPIEPDPIVGDDTIFLVTAKATGINFGAGIDRFVVTEALEAVVTDTDPVSSMNGPGEGIFVDASGAYGSGAGSLPDPVQVTARGMPGYVAIRDVNGDPLDDGNGNELYGVLFHNTTDDEIYLVLYSDPSGVQTITSIAAFDGDIQFIIVQKLSSLSSSSLIRDTGSFVDLVPAPTEASAWPITTGLPKEGLRVYSDAGTLYWSYDMLAFINDEGNIITRENENGTLSLSGLAADTRYYIYVSTDNSGSTTISQISTSSVRLGGTYTPPGVLTHYREIGEFSTDGSGNAIDFKRIGDRVDFALDSVDPLFVNQTIGATFVEYSYPGKAPARANKVGFNFRQNTGTPARMNIVLADDSSANQRTFEGNYTNSTGNTYDGSDNSLSTERTPNRPDLDNASVWIRAHWTFTSSATYDFYMAWYEWPV